MIGDPSGKDADRNFLDDETLNGNVEAIKTQVGGILKNLATLSGTDFQFEVINNKDFYTNMSYLGFLREVGKHITINQMMAKETVKKRIEDPDKSISYTEFSYMLLQGYDFVRLYQDKNCKLQIS
jgi:tyrosyl-tRNA synthetase